MKMNLKVKGMHCDSCATLIKEDLKELGVKNVSVNVKEGIVSVEFDENKLTINRIKDAIKALNYKAI